MVSVNHIYYFMMVMSKLDIQSKGPSACRSIIVLFEMVLENTNKKKQTSIVSKIPSLHHSLPQR